MTILNAAPRIRKLRKRQQPLDVSLAPQTNNLFIFPNYPRSRKVGPMALRVPRYHQAPTAQPSSRRISAAIVTEIAATVGSNFPDFDRQLNQIKTPLNDLQPAIERLSIFADDRGAVGDQTTDDAAAIQSAMDELNAAGGGRLIFTPGKSYLSSVIYCKPNIVIDLNRATLIAKASSDNELFAFGVGIAGQTKIALTSAVQGATSITVSDSSSFVIGERILISAGTFTGSGVEEGPIEYNTVTAKPDGTHITVQRPLRYSYSAFGLPGAASPGIYRVESFSRGLIHDVRITNGTLKAKTGENVLLFNGSGERIEVDHLLIDGVGNQVQTGGYLSQYWFHDNVVRGLSQAVGGGLNAASMVESKIERNHFQLGDDSGSNSRNALQLEVTCRDNWIADNTFGPHRATTGGTIEVTLYGFNNAFVRNKIWGLGSDINSGVGTIGIRTYALSASPPAGLGNLILDNQIIDIMQAIGDTLPESIIANNIVTYTGSHANTQGIISNSGKGIFGPNRITGATNPYWDGSSAVPRIQTDIGTRPIFWLTGSPEGVVTASVGALAIRSDGAAGTILYVKESGSGNTGWIAYAGGAALAQISALSPSNDDFLQRKSGAWTNRTIAQVKTDLAIPTYTTLTSAFTNSTATLQAISGLSQNVTSGKKYVGLLVLFVNDSVSTDGIQVDMGGGSAGETGFRGEYLAYDSGFLFSTHKASSTSAASAGAIVGNGMILLHFRFDPSSTGTLIPRAAQNTHSTGTLTVYQESYMRLEELP